jgi:predicted ArsR family transcriptional regulator
MPRIQVTENDLLDAWKAALVKTGDGVTATEMTESAGVGLGVVRKFLHALNKQGRLEVVRVRRTDMTGRNILVPAYRMKKAGK